MSTSISPSISGHNFKQTLDKVRAVCLSNPIEGIEKVKALQAEIGEGINEKITAKLSSTMGVGYYAAKDYVTALQYFIPALKVFQEQHSVEDIIGTQNWMGLSYRAVGEPDRALELLFESLNLAQIHKLSYLEFRIHSCLGSVYQSIENSEKAIECFEKVLQSPYSHRAIALSNLSSIYSNQGNHKKALEYLKEAYELRETTEVLIQRGYITLNLVICLGEVREYSTILSKIEELKEFAEVLKDTFFVHHYFGALMGLYLRCSEDSDNPAASKLIKIIDLKDSIAYLEKSAESLETDNISSKINACELLIAYCELNKDWKQVVYYQKKLIGFNAKKFETDKMEATERLLIKHEVAQKEQKIKIQELELEKKEALEKINQQLEEKVAKRTAKLTLQNQQLREFAFIVSHDLREPLCNIHGITHLLTETYQDELKGDMEVFLTQIGSSAEYMNRLLKDLLDYTILDKKIQESGFNRVDCMVVLEEVKQALALKIQDTNALIEVGSLPQLNGSSYAIRLLFEQLLSNALKFKSPKRPCRIQLKCIEKPDFYQFSITDNGIGIDRASQQRIFRVFQRLNRHDYGGTGIGLAICRKIIQLLEGNIFVESELGIGSTFYFTVPKK